MLSKSFDIVCVTETWLSQFVYNNEILPSTFSIYHRDRDTRDGGVMIAVSDSVPSKLAFTSTSIQMIIVELCLTPKVLICCLYIPPASSPV